MRDNKSEMQQGDSTQKNNQWLRSLRMHVFTVGHNRDCMKDYFKKMTRAYIEKKCKMAVDDGANSIMLAVGHYRWDFVEYFDEIEKFIHDCGESCYKYSLKLCEHHSVNLTAHLPKGIKYKKWDLAKTVKLDFRDGRPFFTNNWGSYALCCTNPVFKEAYFDIAKRFVVNSRVDLYMPDDMGLANSFYDCGCSHCRSQFRKHTGYDAPRVGKLDMNFFMNIENPAWRAWVRFRSQKVGLFISELREFLDSEGRRDLALTSCNSDSLQNLSRMFGCDQETHINGGLDMAFHEMCEPQTYFWPRSVVERQTNIGISNSANIPLFAHSYIATNEDAVFAMLFHVAHGQAYTMPCHRDGWVKNKNYSVNKFASKFPQLFDARPASNVAVVFSRNTRDFIGKDVFTRTYLEHHTDELAGWCEYIAKMQYPFRVIPESQVENGMLDGIDVLVLPNCSSMTTKAAKVIKAFVKGGGTIIATNETSLYDETGVKRNEFLLTDVLGLTYRGTDSAYSYSIVKNTTTPDTVIHYTFSNFPLGQYDPALRDALFEGVAETRLTHPGQQAIVGVRGKNVQILAHTPIIQGFGFGHAAMTLNKYGKGKALYFSGLPGLMCHMITNYQYSQYGEDPYEFIPPLEPKYGRLIQNIVQWALADYKLFSFNKKIDGMYVNYNTMPDGSRKFLHINATPRLEFEKDGMHYKGLKKLWQKWAELAGKREYLFDNPHENSKYWATNLNYVEIPSVSILIHKDVVFKTARLAGIEFAGYKPLKVTSLNGHKQLHIPKGLVGRYAFIELT